MKGFVSTKRKVLHRLGRSDNSRKGEVDEQAWPFIKTINALDEYYTTSSCAGRINVFKEPVSGKKHDAEWLFVTHDVAHAKDVLQVLQGIPQETLWLRMEPPIFHVACKDQAAAEWLLRVCQGEGWKRSGIISVGAKDKERVMIEIVGNERVDTPLSSGGKLLFDEQYIKFLVMKANEKLLLSREKMEALRLAIGGSEKE
ncbi:hypothetical protein GF367_01370 [Candidatus Woesearchaeota archaeon]|nr:hypothetical protein [Candidatus Woesearchaeota archaeon]